MLFYLSRFLGFIGKESIIQLGQIQQDKRNSSAYWNILLFLIKIGKESLILPTQKTLFSFFKKKQKTKFFEF
jgi:hypothetical protein